MLFERKNENMQKKNLLAIGNEKMDEELFLTPMKPPPHIQSLATLLYPNKNCRSSAVSLPSASVHCPTVPSKMSRFFSWSFNMRSSIVPAATKWIVLMGLY